MNWPSLLLSAFVGSAVIFTAAFVVARRMDNYGVVDIAWSYAFALLALYYAMAADGWPVRRWMIAILVVVWSTRLGTHLAIRILGHHPKEDGRYQQLRRDWSFGFAVKMFVFFQAQALSVIILGAVFLPPALNPAPSFRPIELAGIVLWLIAFAGEAISDFQLARFKRRPANRGKVCDVGLWRYSRHPNYFFEWLVWLALFVFALGSPMGWIGIIGPAGILWLLLRVSGIPMTEQQSLRSRGDAYRRYQQTTSAFFPLPPKSAQF